MNDEGDLDIHNASNIIKLDKSGGSSSNNSNFNEMMMVQQPISESNIFTPQSDRHVLLIDNSDNIDDSQLHSRIYTNDKDNNRSKDGVVDIDIDNNNRSNNINLDKDRGGSNNDLKLKTSVLVIDNSSLIGNSML